MSADKYAPTIAQPPSDDVPVTMAISRVAKRGQETELETWIDGVADVVGRFPGNRGIQVIRPRDPSDPEYVLLVSFDHWRNLRTWIASREPPVVNQSVRTGGCTTPASRPYAASMRSATADEFARNRVTPAAELRSQRLIQRIPCRASGRTARGNRSRSSSKCQA